MPAIVAASAGEALLADAFMSAAPEMFTEFVAAPTIAGAFEGLAADAALGSLGGLGMVGLEGISGMAPSLGQSVAQGITSGGMGAGASGINEAMIAQQQANAMQAANSGIQQAPQAGERFANATSASFPPEGPAAPEMSAMNNPPPNTWPAGSPAPTPSALEGGFQKAMDWIKKNPLQAASMGMNVASLFKKSKSDEGPEPYSGILTKYKMSPDFKGRYANPADFQYTPKVYNMAEGGIAQIAGGGPIEQMSNANAIGANTGYPMADINKGAYATPWQTPISRNVIAGTSDTGVNPMTGEMQFASGGIASFREGDEVKDSGQAMMDYYERMTKRPTTTGATQPHAGHGDPGIYYDLDPETRYLDALTAAQVRMAKVNKRANVNLPGMKRPTPMGQLNMVPVTMKGNPNAPDMTEAAQGGIMSLGGYAAGGNPRLLKGPGDGMSDNIPATIAGKQPARLADGEFVVPADVVSHLGNGSTDAGAKKLHQMMTTVRKARTGNPKQGKQINPNKYMPK